MKNLSLKMDDLVFNETEKITLKINKNRNSYINEAVEFYNLLQKRKNNFTAVEKRIPNGAGRINESTCRI
jgi:hypothetical protein